MNMTREEIADLVLANMIEIGQLDLDGIGNRRADLRDEIMRIPLSTTFVELEDQFELDSLDRAELFIALEDETSVEIPDGAISSFRTIGDIVTHIEAGRGG